MPFVILARTDIPNSVLQLTELKPNNSQRNYVYDPVGQSKYVQGIPTSDTVATTGAGPIATSGAANGLAAYLIDNVEDASGTALTAAVANASATAIIAAARAGQALTTAALTALMVGAGATAGTAVDGGASTGSVDEVLSILSGRSYFLPGSSQVEDGVNAFVPAKAGSFNADSEYLQVYDTSAFKVSNGSGQIAKFKSSSFSYAGTQSRALVVYADDGTVI